MDDQDYDQETDEFAGYSGSNAQQYSDATIAAQHAITRAQEKQVNKDRGLKQTVQSSSSQVSTKSSQQKQREKNMKEVKMYYWTKVDKGDTNEIIKILTFAKQHFTKENEMFEIVNCTNSDGFTPLHLAACEGHCAPIEVLIKFGAHVDARTNNFRTPLHIACLRGNLSVI